MTNKEFKNEYKEFCGLIGKYPMLNDAFVKLPNLIKFTIFLERKLGILSNESIFRVISTMHYEYNNIAATLSSVIDTDKRDYTFQVKNVDIWNSVFNQIFNSISMVSVLGDRNDSEYMRMANDGVANLDYFNVYYSLVKYQLNSKVGDRWSEIPSSMKLFLTIINNFDDDFKMEDVIKSYFTEVDEVRKANPTLDNKEFENIKLFYAAISCSEYIHDIESEVTK